MLWLGLDETLLTTCTLLTAGHLSRKNPIGAGLGFVAYEILNSTKLLARKLDVDFTNIKPLTMRINIHDKKNFKIC